MFTNSFHFSCLVLIKIHNKIQSDIQQVLQITSCSQCLKTSKTFSYFSPSHVLPKQINDKMFRLTNKSFLSTFPNYSTTSQIILELIRNQYQKQRNIMLFYRSIARHCFQDSPHSMILDSIQLKIHKNQVHTTTFSISHSFQKTSPHFHPFLINCPKTSFLEQSNNI